MYLICALVSSFLFVSAVLAEGFGKWAGAFYPKSLTVDEGFVTHAGGTFTVPHPRGVPGSGFIIAVGIDGSGCQTASLAGGIRAVITEWYGFDTIAWMQFSPHVPIFHPVPQDFIIHPGDRLKMTVNQTSSQTNGYIKIENITAKKSWSDSLANPLSFPLCQKNAFWAIGISEPESGIWPLIDFNTLVFTDLWYSLGHGDQQPRDDLRLVALKESKGNMTTVQLDSSFDVILKYEYGG